MEQYALHYTDRLFGALRGHGLEVKDYETYYQLNSCQAWYGGMDILNVYTGEVFEDCPCLQSYNTLVAVIVNGVLYRGQWSRTTSKQITKWASNYRGKYWKEVYF